MPSEVLSASIVQTVYQAPNRYSVAITLTMSERISAELINRIAKESWVNQVVRQAKYLTVRIILRKSVDLVEVDARLSRLLKEWHQESSIILDDYRPLKIMRTNKNVTDEYFEPEKNLPQALLLSVQIRKQVAVLLEEYHIADRLQQQELDLRAHFWFSAFYRSTRS